MLFFKTKITIKNRADNIRQAIDYFVWKNNTDIKDILESFIFEGDKITVKTQNMLSILLNNYQNSTTGCY